MVHRKPSRRPTCVSRLRDLGTELMPDSEARAAARAAAGSVPSHTVLAAVMKKSRMPGSTLSRRRSTWRTEACISSSGCGGPTIWRFLTCQHQRKT